MTVRRHPELRGLGYGIGKAPPPQTVQSERAYNVSQAVLQSVKQIKQHPLLAGVRYNEAAYRRAREQASSVVEAAADMAGTTTLSKADTQQLILGGLNILGNGANMLGLMALEPGAEWRGYEERLIEAMDKLATHLNALVAEAQREGRLSGLGLIMIAIVVGIIAYYLGASDETIEVMREVCGEHPDSAGCIRLIDEGSFNPFKPAADEAGKVVKWVGIGAAVLLGGFLIYTFGPALMGGAKRVRGRSLRGPRRVYDLDGPSSYDLEV